MTSRVGPPPPATVPVIKSQTETRETQDRGVGRKVVRTGETEMSRTKLVKGTGDSEGTLGWSSESGSSP